MAGHGPLKQAAAVVAAAVAASAAAPPIASTSSAVTGETRFNAASARMSKVTEAFNEVSVPASRPTSFTN